MNHLLRPQIWPSFLASSGVGPCDVPFRYASDQSRGTAGRLPCGTPIFFALAALRSVPQAGSQFRGLATAIHEIAGLELPHHRIIIQVVGDRPADTVYFLQVVRKELDLHRFGVV